MGTGEIRVNDVERSIFKTCDILGLYGTDLDEGTAYLLGRAVGSRAQGRRVVVGADVRPSSPILARSLVNGLLRSGADVIDLGQAPTPALHYARAQQEAYGTVVVTGSHHPAAYNGFRITLGDLPMTPEELAALRLSMESGVFAENLGHYERGEVLDDYRRSLEEAFSGSLRTERHVVVDAGSGALSDLAPSVLEALGQRVERLCCDPDGTFPHRDPNPALPSSLQALRERVLATGAELGLAYDGDGDRLILVDGRGRVQPADRTQVLLIRHLLPEAPGAKVIYDLKSSSIVPEEIVAAGGAPLLERPGQAFMVRRFLTEGALLAGSLSGHYALRACGRDDALYATLALLRALDAQGATYTEAIDSVPAYPNTPDLRVPCTTPRARRIVEELREAFADRPMHTVDGVRIEFPDGWALARPATAEPLLTLRYEAHTREALEEIQERVHAASPTLQDVLAYGR